MMPMLALGAEDSLAPPISDYEGLEVMLRELGLPQVSWQTTHYLYPGLYIRQTFIPAASFILGRHHRMHSLNALLAGDAAVLFHGGAVVYPLSAPLVFVGGPGRKILVTITDVCWVNVWPIYAETVEEAEAIVFQPLLYPKEEEDT